ncbi:MAG: Uma2 family endonuclease [Brachymonas sp.]|nr:Uma2 family endonuclease [Brachymonas sp.]
MGQALQKNLSVFEFLDFDNQSQDRHEYVAGRIFAMTGGTMRHNRVSGNVFRALSGILDGTPCQVFINDMKLHVQAADSVYYPDVMVYCGSALAGDEKLVSDASLLVEVSSESTAEIDRREKLSSYRKLPSLKAYWIVSQTERRVEMHSRDDLGRWQAVVYEAGEKLPDVGLLGQELSLDTFYSGTDLA